MRSDNNNLRQIDLITPDGVEDILELVNERNQVIHVVGLSGLLGKGGVDVTKGVGDWEAEGFLVPVNRSSENDRSSRVSRRATSEYRGRGAGGMRFVTDVSDDPIMGPMANRENKNRGK